MADRVAETTTSTGTGNLTLGGAVPRHVTFASAGYADGAVPWVVLIEHETIPTEWERCRASISGGELVRGELLQSHTGSRINFSAGDKIVALVVSTEDVETPDGAAAKVSAHNSAGDAHGARLPPTPVGQADGRMLAVASDALGYIDAPTGEPGPPGMTPLAVQHNPQGGRILPGWYVGTQANRALTGGYASGFTPHVPIFVAFEMTFQGAAINVLAEGNAGSVMRIGIYEDDLTVPGLRAASGPLIDMGTVALDSTGVKAITLSPNLVLAPGWYHLSWTHNATGCTVRGADTTQTTPPVTSVGHAGSVIPAGSRCILRGTGGDPTVALPATPATGTVMLDPDAAIVTLILA